MAEPTTVYSKSLMNVKPGDIIVRHFYGMEMKLTVFEVKDGIVDTVPGYQFYQDTGLEYDPELGMTKENNLTCSWIVAINPD